ncbi:uncharacterized protein LOC122732125 [Dromiciops gliroides]|uniref:uncharacterized protein LOC122732125 n=1 Tax=Dromiciops gliroides TaxID=33562 RepID=UPI001CC5F13D|nr:uncharacterized protein LOC122732125 [Dromiciops gliroides]
MAAESAAQPSAGSSLGWGSGPRTESGRSAAPLGAAAVAQLELGFSPASLEEEEEEEEQLAGRPLPAFFPMSFPSFAAMGSPKVSSDPCIHFLLTAAELRESRCSFPRCCCNFVLLTFWGFIWDLKIPCSVEPLFKLQMFGTIRNPLSSQPRLKVSDSTWTKEREGKKVRRDTSLHHLSKSWESLAPFRAQLKFHYLQECS